MRLNGIAARWRVLRDFMEYYAGRPAGEWSQVQLNYLIKLVPRDQTTQVTREVWLQALCKL